MAKTANFHPDQRTVEILEKIYPSLNFAANRALSSWVYLRAATLTELKRMFSKLELNYLIDLYYSKSFDPRSMIRKQTTKQEIDDGDKYLKLGEQWNVDVFEFAQKIDKLTAAQVLFLNEWAQLYNEGKYSERGISQDMYCSEFLLF
jgi:hypothetical protein